MTVSSLQRRFLVPRTPTIRPMGTITASPRRWDKGLYASDLTTRDGATSQMLIS